MHLDLLYLVYTIFQILKFKLKFCFSFDDWMRHVRTYYLFPVLDTWMSLLLATACTICNINLWLHLWILILWQICFLCFLGHSTKLMCSPINLYFKYNVPCFPHPYISVSWLGNLYGQNCQRFYNCWNSFFCCVKL